MNFEPYRHYYRGCFFEKFRRPQKAIEAYQLALRHEPKFLKAASCIAHLYASLNQFEHAERYFLEAMRMNPADGDLQFNLGFIYERQGKHEDAIRTFREAVRLKPKIDRAWYGMGLAYAALGQHDEAANALEEASKLQPMTADIWYALGMACHHIHAPDRVKEIVMHLHRIDPLACRRLVRDAERADLLYLVKDLAV